MANPIVIIFFLIGLVAVNIFLWIFLRGRIENALRSEFSSNRKESTENARSLREEILSSFQTLSRGQSTQLKSFEEKIEKMSRRVEEKLKNIQEDNQKQLDKMRDTVEEKLQATLEKRLSLSFKQVSERLGQVHEGLGEMKNLAAGVGDLKKVLTNVKARGTWGEVQLGNILEEILSPEQYEKNVSIKRNSLEAVEYAVKLPGQGLEKGENLYLPIDSKFPQEDYQRLLKAQEESDAPSAATASANLEAAIKREARTIRDKYIVPPKTTDFAIMFLPTEGLYAEVLRRPGLAELLQRDYRIIVTGPTNFAGLLNSLSVGFRTLAIQKRSSEVWKLLGAIKTQFGSFSNLLDNVQKKLEGASKEMEKASQKSRTIEKRLTKVEELPQSESTALLSGE